MLQSGMPTGTVTFLFTDTYQNDIVSFARRLVQTKRLPGQEQDAAAVAQICPGLDGIPLALELATSRVRVLSLETIAERLGARFRLLTGGSCTALKRQQTLEQAIALALSERSDQ